MDQILRVLYVIFLIGVISTVSKTKSLPLMANYHKVGRLMVDFDWPQMKSDIPRLPHQTSCNHFYSAEPDGTYKLRKCPENEIFDYVTLNCRRKTLSQCWSSQFDHGYKPLYPKKHFRCPVPWGRYPDVLNCKEYYQCHHGRAARRICPNFTLFDRVENRCMLESEAICYDVTGIVEKYYKCPKTWGKFLYSKDCSKYHECIRKISIIQSCAENFLFDERREECIPKELAHCGHRYNPYDEHASSSVSKESFTTTASQEASIFSPENNFENSSTKAVSEDQAMQTLIESSSENLTGKLSPQVTTGSASEEVITLSTIPETLSMGLSGKGITGISFPELISVRTSGKFITGSSFPEFTSFRTSRKDITGSSSTELTSARTSGTGSPFLEISSTSATKNAVTGSLSLEVTSVDRTERVTIGSSNGGASQEVVTVSSSHEASTRGSSREVLTGSSPAE